MGSENPPKQMFEQKTQNKIFITIPFSYLYEVGGKVKSDDETETQTSVKFSLLTVLFQQ